MGSSQMGDWIVVEGRVVIVVVVFVWQSETAANQLVEAKIERFIIALR